jgi:hypothetical protein
MARSAARRGGVEVQGRSGWRSGGVAAASVSRITVDILTDCRRSGNKFSSGAGSLRGLVTALSMSPEVCRGGGANEGLKLAGCTCEQEASALLEQISPRPMPLMHRSTREAVV